MNYQKNQKGEILDISAVIIPVNSLKPFLKASSKAKIIFSNVFPSILYWARIKGDGTYISQGPGYGEAIIYQQGRITLQNWAVNTGSEDYFLEETSKLMANTSECPENLYIWETNQGLESIAEKLRLNPRQAYVLNFNKVDQARARANTKDGYELNLLPRSVLRQRAIASYMIYGGIAFFILSLLVLPVSKLAGQKRYLTKVEKRVEQISGSAEELTSIREESREILESIESMAEMKKSYPSTINILRELTESIPESAWVNSMSYSNMKVNIQGEADSATSVIEAVENSHMFSGVQFTSPVTKSGSRDRFSLEAEVVL
ncbi:MAG: PilN domain-containing protein [Desulfonatronovibrio sp.]